MAPASNGALLNIHYYYYYKCSKFIIILINIIIIINTYISTKRYVNNAVWYICHTFGVPIFDKGMWRTTLINYVVFRRPVLKVLMHWYNFWKDPKFYGKVLPVIFWKTHQNRIGTLEED